MIDASCIPDFHRLIRQIPDYPKPGILFRDITPMLADAGAFSGAIDAFGRMIEPYRVDALVAIESRGFLFGAALAVTVKLPLQIVRKPGKLPAKVVAVDYALEYGVDRLEMHDDAVVPGQRYAIIDDVLATGGTAAAVATLIESLGGTAACCAVLIELAALNGRAKLGQCALEALIQC